MHEFILLQRIWEQTIQEYDISTLLHEKMPILLADTTENGIHSTWLLLLSFGSGAICFVLHTENEQLALRDNIPIEARLIWQRNIITHVSSDDLWNTLYKKGAFHAMEQVVLESTAWNVLNTTLQQKVLQISLSMVNIPSGSFTMGAEENDEEAFENEYPRHIVQVHKPFSVCKHLITQGLYEHITGSSPSFFVGALRPVECVSWIDAIRFCILLNEQQRKEPVYEANSFTDTTSWIPSIHFHPNRKGFALLSEKQWEFAAKAGMKFSFSGGVHLDAIAWWKGNSNGYTHAVGQKEPNRWGLYDMTGNVSEWVWDPFQSYKTSDAQPHLHRIVRGGSFYEYSATLRNSARSTYDPTTKSELIGFRIQHTCIDGSL